MILFDARFTTGQFNPLLLLANGGISTALLFNVN